MHLFGIKLGEHAMRQNTRCMNNASQKRTVVVNFSKKDCHLLAISYVRFRDPYLCAGALQTSYGFRSLDRSRAARQDNVPGAPVHEPVCDRKAYRTGSTGD